MFVVSVPILDLLSFSFAPFGITFGKERIVSVVGYRPFKLNQPVITAIASLPRIYDSIAILPKMGVSCLSRCRGLMHLDISFKISD
jgi:hypothetical protein